MLPKFWLFCCTFVIVSIFLLTADLEFSQKHSREFVETTSSTSDEVEIFREWHACMKLDFDQSADNFWKSFGGEVGKCSKIETSNFKNKDEIKHALLPKTKNNNKEEEIVVTLGVGRDIGAEQQLKKALLDLKTPAKFYGADPMYLQNAKIFSEIGSYFPLAVGATTGMYTASIMNEAAAYENSEVYHIELTKYLKNYLKIKHIDHFWMDNEYAEYELFPYFYKGGQLEKAGITVCQMNMEVHNPSLEQKEKFKVFVKQILEDKQWAFLKSYAVAHYRLFMFNFGDEFCVKKYFNK